MASTLLDIQELTVEFRLKGGETLRVLNKLDLSIFPGETLGLVGRSGSGKSVLAHAILRLVPPPGRNVHGRILWKGKDLLQYSEAEMNTVRGAQIAMISQNARLSFNPVYTIGHQLIDILRLHRRCNAKDARARALQLLQDVGIPEATDRFDSYPHQFSQGMCQRVMIAAALACQPSLLIADEITASLDVLVQAHIIELLQRLQEKYHMTVLFISHDFGVVAQLCDRVAVLKEGQICEVAPAEEIYAAPQTEYTRQLLNAVPVPNPKARRNATSVEQAQFLSHGMENTYQPPEQ